MKPLNTFAQLKDLSVPDRIEGARKAYKAQETFRLSPYQTELYNRCLLGINSIPKDQVRKMELKELVKIEADKKKAQGIINVLKQSTITNSISALFNKLFPAAPPTNGISILMKNVTDPYVNSDLNFSQLGLSKTVVVKALIRGGVLNQEDFLCLKVA